MKKIKLLFFLLLLLGGVIFAAFVSPYLIYSKTLHQGMSGSYINVKGLTKAARSSEPFILAAVEDTNLDLWKNFHFSNFIITFPVHHPQVIVIPEIKEYFENSFLQFGTKFINNDLEEYSSFMINKPERFDWNDFDGKLFSLPIAKRMIDDKSIQEVWEDLFLRDLRVLFKGSSFSHVLSIPYRDLIYNLFIQSLRLKYFPEGVVSLSFIKEKNLGVVELLQKDQRYKKELIFSLYDGFVYPLALRSKKWTPFAENIRRRILNNIEFKADEEVAAALTYAEYKLLSYKARIDQEGMTYLYAAWSHVTGNKDFLREMIQFLERGKNNYHHLSSLYKYGYKRFGSSFSSKESMIEERSDTRLERKMKEELDQEIAEEKSRVIQDVDGKFQNEQEQVNYFLRKAKDSGKNSDQEDDSISE